MVGGSTAVGAVGVGLPAAFKKLADIPEHDPQTDGDKVVSTFCEMCFWKCGVDVHVKNDRITKIVGNPEHPLSNGRLCPRGTGGMGLAYDPDRLTKPLLRRNGERGEPDHFEEVEWDEALDFVADKMRTLAEEHGPDSLALYAHGYGASWFKTMLKAYGTHTFGAPSNAQCRGARQAGFELTFGEPAGSPEKTDIANARCITLIGSHLGENMHNTQVQWFAEAIGNGADLIVVDPRFSTAAGKARHWLPIKPGTDLALLLAWIHVIIGEDLYDHAYVEEYAIGFEQLREHVADKTPDWASVRTGIDADTILETARIIAGASPASLIHPGRHTAWYGDDTQRSRAIAILNAILGSWGRKGGFYFNAINQNPVPSYASTLDQPFPSYPHDIAHHQAEEHTAELTRVLEQAQTTLATAQSQLALALTPNDPVLQQAVQQAQTARDAAQHAVDEDANHHTALWGVSNTQSFPMSSSHSLLANGLRDASLPGAEEHFDNVVKGWFVYGSNLLQSLPQPEITKQALQNLDFVVSVDVLPTEINGWADVVLPEACYLERYDDLHSPGFFRSYTALRQPAIDPPGDAKPGSWIAKEIATRLGLEAFFPWNTVEEYLDARLQAAGTSLQEMKDNKGVILGEENPPRYIEDGIVPNFPTASGKIELFSEYLESAGLDPIPNYTQHPAPAQGQFRLLFGRTPTHTFGRSTNNQFLSRVYDKNVVWLNAQSATELGLASGDQVYLVNQDDVRVGPVGVRATQAIRSDCVFIVHGFGHTDPRLKFAYNRGIDSTTLCSNVAIDPIMGGTGMNVNFVTIERADS